ncbi:MAG: hypothetical protein A2286_00725 [Gammaproteobacteria bacterium RIFOXYA12_FULL_61_12]|nr:MAG: hypothetical protein A2286_00725 [Gammaproteobacteria bacterium RIFOXYA12_FULL_61_12]
MTNKIFSTGGLEFPRFSAPIVARKVFLLHGFKMMQGNLVSYFCGLRKKLGLSIWVDGKKNKNIVLYFFHSLVLRYKSFVHLDWLLINGFFACWILEHVKLSPKTRTFLIRELFRLQCLDRLEGRAYSDGCEGDEQWPENYIRHYLSPNVK